MKVLCVTATALAREKHNVNVLVANINISCLYTAFSATAAVSIMSIV